MTNIKHAAEQLRKARARHYAAMDHAEAVDAVVLRTAAEMAEAQAAFDAALGGSDYPEREVEPQGVGGSAAP